MDLNEGVSVASFTKVHVDAVEKDEEAGLKEDPFNEENESDGTGFDEYGEVDSEKGESEITESEEDESWKYESDGPESDWSALDGQNMNLRSAR